MEKVNEVWVVISLNDKVWSEIGLNMRFFNVLVSLKNALQLRTYGYVVHNSRTLPHVPFGSQKGPLWQKAKVTSKANQFFGSELIN